MGDILDGGGIEPAPEQPVAVPIVASGTLTKTQAIFIIMQVVAGLGGLIAFLGLGEKTWINQVYLFLSDNKAVPVIGLMSWILIGIVGWVRNKKRAIDRAVLAYMANNRVGQLKGPVHPAVAAAIEAALQARRNDR